MSRAIAISSFLIAVLIATAGFCFIAISWSAPSENSVPGPAASIGFIAAALVYSVIGVVLALRRSENLIGWVFLAYGVFGTLDITNTRYQLYTLVYRPDTSLPQFAELVGLVEGLWMVPMSLTVLTVILFPQGRPSGRPWSLAALAIGVLTVVAVALSIIEPGPFNAPFDIRENPLGVTAYKDFTFLADLLTLPIALTGLVAAVNLLPRLFASTGDEHEQMKWFAYVAGWLPLLVTSYLVIGLLGTIGRTAVDLLTISLIAALPLAIGIAILKYRLYDIDILVNRTLVYVPLTAILAGLFTATTGLFRAIFTEATGFGSDSAIAVSTLAVVAFFTPVKNKLQSFVDKLFKESSDPTKPLVAMADDARRVFSVLDAEGFLQDFADKAAMACTSANALVYLNGRQTPIVVSGDPLAECVLSFPLIESGTHAGRLEIGPSKAFRPFSPEQVAVIEKQTDILARGLVFYAAANGLQIKRPDQDGPGVSGSMIGVL